MAQNKLKLYDDNTEAPLIRRTVPLFLKRSPPLFVLAVPTFLSRPAFGNLVIWYRITSLNKHISNVCRSTYVEIRRISSVKTTETLVCAFVLFKLDYCHSLLSGCPLYILRRLQKVQIVAEKLVLKSRRRDHVQPLLWALRLLPVQVRIDYKFSAIRHNYFSDSPPSSPLWPSHCLHTFQTASFSADTRTLRIPNVNNLWCNPLWLNGLKYKLSNKLITMLELKLLDFFLSNTLPKAIEWALLAKWRGITPPLFAAWGRTQERTEAACPIRPRVVFSCPLASAF